MKIKIEEGLCTLSITDCTKEHEGSYTIEVTNTAGSAKANVKVTVEEPPKGKATV